MHRINARTSLNETFADQHEDDDDNFGNSSNRFLKSNKKSQDPFQRELEDKVKIRRTPTPKSISTDSDVEIDATSDLNTSNPFGLKTGMMTNQGWTPGVKFSESSDRSKDRVVKQNKIFDDKDEESLSSHSSRPTPKSRGSIFKDDFEDEIEDPFKPKHSRQKFIKPTKHEEQILDPFAPKPRNKSPFDHPKSIEDPFDDKYQKKSKSPRPFHEDGNDDPIDDPFSLKSSSRFIRPNPSLQETNETNIQTQDRPRRRSRIKEQDTNPNRQTQQMNHSTRMMPFGESISTGISIEDGTFDSRTLKDPSRMSSEQMSPRKSLRFDNNITQSSASKSSGKGDVRSSSVGSMKSSRDDSPQTSVCEEIEILPEQENQKEEKAKPSHYTTEKQKTLETGISTVKKAQSESNPSLPPKQKKKTVKTNKFNNIGPKITTRLDLRSISMANLTDDSASTRPTTAASAHTTTLYSRGSSADLNSDRSFTSCQSVRDAAYITWYRNKLELFKQQKLQQQLQQQQDQPDTTTLNKQDKETVGLQAFESWKKNKAIELKKQKKLQKEKEQNQTQKSTDSNVAYEIWKKKAEEKQQNELQIKKEQKMKEEKERNEKKEKKEAWKEKVKEKVDQSEKRKKELAQKQKERQQKEEEEKKLKEQQNKKQNVSYEDWLNSIDVKIKERNENYTKFVGNNRRAWRPNNPTVISGR